MKRVAARWRNTLLLQLLPFCAIGVQTAWAAAYVRIDGGVIRAGNDRIELAFRGSDGNLMSIRDKRVDTELLPARTGYWNGPVLRYLRPGTKEPGDYLTLTSSRRFQSKSE